MIEKMKLGKMKLLMVFLLLLAVIAIWIVPTTTHACDALTGVCYGGGVAATVPNDVNYIVQQPLVQSYTQAYLSAAPVVQQQVVQQVAYNPVAAIVQPNYAAAYASCAPSAAVVQAYSAPVVVQQQRAYYSAPIVARQRVVQAYAAPIVQRQRIVRAPVVVQRQRVVAPVQRLRASVSVGY